MGNRFWAGKVSIHAPARGATIGSFQPLHSHQFQSTLPRGEATCKLQLRNEMIDVSIHAPARGATSGGSGLRVLPEFQSTLPRGERPTISCISLRHGATPFQSTLPRGSDLLSVKIKPAKPASFNPRSRGSDITLFAASKATE